MTLKGGRDGDGVVLTISDDGPGIQADRRAAMLERCGGLAVRVTFAGP